MKFCIQCKDKFKGGTRANYCPKCRKMLCKPIINQNRSYTIWNGEER